MNVVNETNESQLMQFDFDKAWVVKDMFECNFAKCLVMHYGPKNVDYKNKMCRIELNETWY